AIAVLNPQFRRNGFSSCKIRKSVWPCPGCSVTVSNKQFLVFVEERPKVGPIGEVMSRDITRNVIRYFSALEMEAAEMKEIHGTPVTQPGSVVPADLAAMQVPIGHVVAGVLFNEDVSKEDRRQVDKLLVDEIAIRHVDHAAVIQLAFPPAQKGRRIFTRIDS